MTVGKSEVKWNKEGTVYLYTVADTRISRWMPSNKTQLNYLDWLGLQRTYSRP